MRRSSLSRLFDSVLTNLRAQENDLRRLLPSSCSCQGNRRVSTLSIWSSDASPSDVCALWIGIPARLYRLPRAHPHEQGIHVDVRLLSLLVLSFVDFSNSQRHFRRPSLARRAGKQVLQYSRAALLRSGTTSKGQGVRNGIECRDGTQGGIREGAVGEGGEGKSGEECRVYAEDRGSRYARRETNAQESWTVVISLVLSSCNRIRIIMYSSRESPQSSTGGTARRSVEKENVKTSCKVRNRVSDWFELGIGVLIVCNNCMTSSPLRRGLAA